MNQNSSEISIKMPNTGSTQMKLKGFFADHLYSGIGPNAFESSESNSGVHDVIVDINSHSLDIDSYSFSLIELKTSMKEKDPNFFVVGVVKGGTTSIYNYLSQHPDVYLTSIKETNHFSDEDMRYEHFEKQYKIDSGLDIKAYLAKESKDLVHIAHVREWSDYLKLYEDVDHEKARGEVCNSYMLCPSASNQIYSAIPKAKIIVILREPVKRMYSQYLMNLREAKVLNRSFREEIEYDRSKDLNGWGVSHNYFALGHYSEQLKTLFRSFWKRQSDGMLF